MITYRVVCRLGLFLAVCASGSVGGATISLDDLPLDAESYFNGDPGGLGDGMSHDGSFTSGGGTSHGATFNNLFTNFGGGFTSWTGWAYANVTDVTTSGYTNQYAAFHLPAGGGDASANYAVAFGDASSIALPAGYSPRGARITNTTYAALSMRDGDPFAKKFGGPSGNDADYFRLDIVGRRGGPTGSILGTVPFYLADYRFADNGLDYLVDEWTSVDLSALASADTLTFAFDSTDIGMFGINTPLYFALDNLIVEADSSVPEPSTGLVVLAVGLPVFARRPLVRRVGRGRMWGGHLRTSGVSP